MPAPGASNAGSFAAVKLRLQALKTAVKRTVSAAAAAATSVREVPGYVHGGGGYPFRQRKAAGALREPSAEESPEEEMTAAKPSRAGVKRTRTALKQADEEEANDDEALARRLQEQEDALATRGRATRGALRVTLKPSKPKGPASKGPSSDNRNRTVRSSSRLKPQSAEPKQRPTTRGSAGMPTTRSHAQEETYSSSEEADRGSDSENSEPDESSPASSADKADSQVEGSNLENDDAAHNGPMVSDSSSDHGSAAQQRSASKRSGERASESRHSSRDSSLARTTKIVKPVVQTKAVEGRKRLRKPS